MDYRGREEYLARQFPNRLPADHIPEMLRSLLPPHTKRCADSPGLPPGRNCSSCTLPPANQHAAAANFRYCTVSMSGTAAELDVTAPVDVPVPLSVKVYVPAVVPAEITLQIGAEPVLLLPPQPLSNGSIAATASSSRAPPRFRLRATGSSRKNSPAKLTARSQPGYSGTTLAAVHPREACVVSVTVAVAVPFAASVTLAGFTVQTGGRLAVPPFNDAVQLRLTVPAKLL
jgi:hypothetical protein